MALYKERVSTLNELSNAAEVFYINMIPDQAVLDAQLSAEAIPALNEFVERVENIAWDVVSIGALIKELVSKHGLKMPKLAMPLRVMLVGQTQAPAVDALVALFSREQVMARIKKHL